MIKLNQLILLNIPLLLSLFIFACDTPSDCEMGKECNNETVSLVPEEDYEMLPAIETEAEKIATAQGVTPLYRKLHPEIYGVTPPPEIKVRRAGEFEPVDTLYLTYVGIPSLDNFFADIVKNTYTEAKVKILVKNSTYQDMLEKLLRSRGIPAKSIEYITMEYDSIWMRDYGPQAVITSLKTIAYIDTKYYPARVYDDGVPTMLANMYGLKAYRPDYYQEGGNFFANGQGICFSADSILEANPGYTVADITKIMKDYFGCSEFHILKSLTGNVIGHIDMFFYIADYDTILLGQYEKTEDPQNYKILEENYAYLKTLKTKDGTPFNIIRVPMPKHLLIPMPTMILPVIRTYMNGVAVNGVVLVPVYLQETSKEAEALQKWQEAFPNRKIVPINADRIAPQYGAIHCITQTIPIP